MEKKDLILQLVKYNDIYKERNTIINFLNSSDDELLRQYVDEPKYLYINQSKPEEKNSDPRFVITQKDIDNHENYLKQKQLSKTFIFIGAILLACILPLALFKNIPTILLLAGILASIVGVTLIVLGKNHLGIVGSIDKNWEEVNRKALRAQEEAKKNNKWNKEEYPKLMHDYNNKVHEIENANFEIKTKYNNEVEKVKPIIAAQRDDYKKRLDEINKEFNDYQNYIDGIYLKHLDEIIQILRVGRADTLKEALNVFESNRYQKELISEQQRKNDILEKNLEEQRYETERNNREMERISEERAREESYNQRQYNEEVLRHNREMEKNSERDRLMQSDISKQLERSAKAAAMCQGCPHVGYCSHLGIFQSDCRSNVRR